MHSSSWSARKKVLIASSSREREAGTTKKPKSFRELNENSDSKTQGTRGGNRVCGEEKVPPANVSNTKEGKKKSSPSTNQGDRKQLLGEFPWPEKTRVVGEHLKGKKVPESLLSPPEFTWGHEAKEGGGRKWLRQLCEVN